MEADIQTNWDHIPMTCEDAKPIAWRSVTDSVVIHVTKASIRNATIENAWFELYEPEQALGTYAGHTRAEVKCLWFGRKPPTTWMHITLLGPHEEVRNYSGDVVADIGLKAAPIRE